jgi:hypothetical protein
VANLLRGVVHLWQDVAMTTSNKYECSIEQVREGADHIRSLVQRGVYPQALLDAYLNAVAQRADA